MNEAIAMPRDSFAARGENPPGLLIDEVKNDAGAISTRSDLLLAGGNCRFDTGE
jgi:hypothetical protein